MLHLTYESFAEYGSSNLKVLELNHLENSMFQCTSIRKKKLS